MANELKHGSVGTELTQAEWEAVGAHVFSSQAAGDIMYASSTSQLSRLGKGADNTVLHLASGIPAWSATLAGLTLTTPTISSTGFANATHAHAASNSGGTVAASALSGTSLASGVVTTSATTVGVLGSGSIASGFGNIDVGASSIAAGSFDASDGNITNVGDIALDTISSDAGTTVSVTLGTDAGDDFIVGNNSALVVEGDTDKVGIGTTTPAYPLTVKGSNAKIQIKATAADEQVVGLYFANTSTEYAGWINYDDVNDELDLSVGAGVRAQIKTTGVVVNNGDIVFEESVNSALVANEVSLGGYELSAGNRALAISQEAPVTTSVDETDFSHNLPVRINGTTYYIMLASSIS